MKSLLIIFVFILSTSAHARGSKRPDLPSEPNPAPTPTPVVSKPTLDFGEHIDAGAYRETASVVGPDVDQSVRGSELTEKRETINPDTVDKCSAENNDTFADQISYYASELLSDVPAMVGMIGSSYGTPSSDANYFPTSLIRHPLCKVSYDSLSATMNKVPSESTIDRLNRFATTINTLRAQVLEGDREAKVELQAEWTRLFSCLAYTESLSTADSSSSNNVANRVAPAGYRKPAGVKFYDDPAQDSASRLNIGMFQFTPNSSGNIRPCLKAWNALNASKPACLVNEKASQSELVKILGSSLQAFNAFCGIHKVVQTFAIQVNTTKTSATHPLNLVNGKLKAHEQRCVTPHFQAGRAYNHFGPFQNSTGSNLEKLFACVENSR